MHSGQQNLTQSRMTEIVELSLDVVLRLILLRVMLSLLLVLLKLEVDILLVHLIQVVFLQAQIETKQ